jgi:hypothetical protein
MRKLVPVVAVVAAMFLVPGVAAAASPTYEVSAAWKLTYIDGRPTVVPPIEDDVVEVTCRRDDQMTDWSVNDEELVAGSWERADGTGIQVQPEFTGEPAILAIKVTCNRG